MRSSALPAVCGTVLALALATGCGSEITGRAYPVGTAPDAPATSPARGGMTARGNHQAIVGQRYETLCTGSRCALAFTVTDIETNPGCEILPFGSGDGDSVLVHLEIETTADFDRSSLTLPFTGDEWQAVTRDGVTDTDVQGISLDCGDDPPNELSPSSRYRSVVGLVVQDAGGVLIFRPDTVNADLAADGGWEFSY
ncbi:hypothetical protein LZP97_27005 (plasmid) [Rhodococcus sp. DMF-1]|uniref:hypothetical protein n=1 Tax=Rhodococcus TaxID=1827 RepID=UPI00066057D6|nr:MULTISPECIES: hypothetical protein [Rhodococcus]UIR36908.1 hypothetical protein LZP97_25570 [Rhodococcus sp. DMF-1]UIR39738.1 hypothetical protein LZP97_27005 [Rhodococcus sp. DMF-1]